jgi:hypothetical protein
METITKPEEGFTPPATAGRDHNILSLNELIAEIDSETAVPFGRGAKEEEIAPKLDGMHTSLKDQYILSYFPRIENAIFPEFNLTAKPTSNICSLQYLADAI